MSSIAASTCTPLHGPVSLHLLLACNGEPLEGGVSQAMVELYEFLLKCSCDLAQEAPPPRKFRMSGRRPH